VATKTEGSTVTRVEITANSTAQTTSAVLAETSRTTETTVLFNVNKETKETRGIRGNNEGAILKSRAANLTCWMTDPDLLPIIFWMMSNPPFSIVIIGKRRKSLRRKEMK